MVNLVSLLVSFSQLMILLSSCTDIYMKLEASGLAATNSIVQLLSMGDHVICIDDVYGGTQRLFRRISAPLQALEFSFVTMADMAELEKVFKPNTKLVWVETPTNPTLKITDIRAVAALARAHGALTVVDNTFMTPYLQHPLDLGADLVVHSVTKYIGGHSDVLMGVIVGRDMEIWKRLRFVQNSVGAVPSPFDCYMALRGLKTLHVRMEAAQKNAIEIALYLEQHSRISKVIYPGLVSHPQHELAKTQQSGFGAMITFYLNGGLEETGVFLSKLKLWTLAESLGAVESLAECPAIMTHASVPKEQRAILGIDDNMVRLSVGIEHVSDLIQDLNEALLL
jgi:cystathionine gamma-lyase